MSIRIPLLFQPIFLLLIHFSCLHHQYCPWSLSFSSFRYEDGDGALDSGESGGGLTKIDSSIPLAIHVVDHRKSYGDRLDVRGLTG